MRGEVVLSLPWGFGVFRILQGVECFCVPPARPFGVSVSWVGVLQPPQSAQWHSAFVGVGPMVRSAVGLCFPPLAINRYIKVVYSSLLLRLVGA